jgi:hypothetical protein
MGVYKEETDFILNNPRTNVKHHGWRISDIGSADSHRCMMIATAESCGIDHQACFGGGYATRDKRNYLYRRQFVDRYGEVAGPIVTKFHFKELRSRLCAVQGDYEREQVYQSYLTNVIGGPGEQDPRYNEFLSAYDNIRKRADELKQEREINRITSSTQWKIKRTALASAFVTKLKAHIKDNIHRPLLAYQTNLKFYIDKKPKYMTRQTPIVMHYKWVDEFMKPFLLAPVRFSTMKNIAEIASLFEAVANGDHSEIDMNKVTGNTVNSVHHSYHAIVRYSPPGIIGATYRNNRPVTGRTIRFWRQRVALLQNES